jgi:signal transduction histidine kinase
VPIPGLPAENKRRIDAIAVDAAGSLWLGGQIGPVRRLESGRLTTLFEGGPSSHQSQTLLVDSTNRVWVGNAGTLVMVSQGRGRTFGQGDGLNIGRVTSLFERAGRVWAGGSGGVALFDGHRFLPLLRNDPVPFERVSGVLEDAQGGLWLHTLGGALHVERSELERFYADPAATVKAESFDALDGLTGSAAESNTGPNLVQGSDGRVWFSRSGGLSSIDPQSIRRNTRAPQCFVQALTVDGQRIEALQGARLPPIPRSLEIAFTATQLTIPERTRFRHRLEGVDSGWVDSGSRRSAFYSGLAPGDYRFRLVAANEDGLWSKTEESIRFTVPPAWFQSWWFRLLCAATGLLMLWLLYRLRVRTIEGRLRIEARAEQAERGRIARELHDTLLQSTQGLVLLFQSVAMRMAKDDPMRRLLDDALDRADAVMAEGRDRVLDLRLSDEPSQSLPEALAATGSELAQGRSISFRAVVEGTPKAVHRAPRDEIYSIGREALLNAFRHANASAIEVHVIFSDRHLVVRIRDDGEGMDARALDPQSNPDHWGVKGMQERAQKMGAAFDLWSRPGAGTEIELKVPSAVAYPEAPSFSPWRAWQRLIGSGA